MTDRGCLAQWLSRHMTLTSGETAFLDGIEHDERTLAAGRTVIPAGADSGGLYLLRMGWAVLRSAPVRGRAAILRVYLPGEVIGLGELSVDRAPHEVRMQTYGAVCTLPGAGLPDLLSAQPRLAALVLALAARDELAQRDACAALSLRAAEDRLLLFLLDLHDRLAALEPAMGDRLFLPFSQAEIGEAVGMTPVYVNKLLRKLSNEGRLVVERPYVRLVDREGMMRQTGYSDRDAALHCAWFPGERVA